MTGALCTSCEENPAAPILCTRCTDRMRRHLDEIGQRRRALTPIPGRGKRGGPSGKPGSRPPGNLTAIAMTDVRSAIRIDDQTGEHDSDDVTCVDAELLALARMTRTQRRFTTPLRDVFDCIRVLNISFDWLSRHPHAHDIAAVLEVQATALATALRDRPEPMIGTCTAAHPERDTCGGPVRMAWLGPLTTDPDQHHAPTHLVCDWCKDRWPLDIATLAAFLDIATHDAHIPVTRAWIVSNCGITSDQLRQWIRRGHVRTTPAGDVNFVDVLRRLTNTPADADTPTDQAILDPDPVS